MKTKECRLLAGTIAVLCAMVQLASAQTPAALDREATFAAARTGKWEVAEAPLTKLADGHPADADACALLAQRRQQQNRAKDAVELMERAVAAQPNRADLQAQLGDALGQRMGEVGFFQRPVMGGKMRGVRAIDRPRSPPCPGADRPDKMLPLRPGDRWRQCDQGRRVCAAGPETRPGQRGLLAGADPRAPGAMERCGSGVPAGLGDSGPAWLAIREPWQRAGESRAEGRRARRSRKR